MSSININVGILGHVDSGKTSLAKCLSTISSTAAFDKNPQSQQRGITLDLGFSSFSTALPEHFKNKCDKDTIQYTLVDCPGHASLIKTIIGGIQIIDIILLVIDITKGIQTQTAECLVIGEITNKKLIIVLNKIDLVPEANRDTVFKKMKQKIGKVLSDTTFSNQEVPMVPTSVNKDDLSLSTGIEELSHAITNYVDFPQRSAAGPFLFAIDHCFAIKGQGTVMTGTILQGSVKVNDTIDVPKLGITKKVKSMQMFRKPLQEGIQGDRLGICVAQFDPKQLERGLACSDNLIHQIHCAIVEINLIKYFKYPVESKSKFNITIGYETVLGQLTLFYAEDINNTMFNLDTDYKYTDAIDNTAKIDKHFALIQFDTPVYAVKNSVLIGSKLDMDIHKNNCRIAFWGKLLETSKSRELLESVNIYKYKTRCGNVDRVSDANNIIVKNMFKKETNLEKFIGMRVVFQTGDVGKIENSFGQSGKIKIYVSQSISEANLSTLKNSIVTLQFKKHLFKKENNISQ